MSVEIMTSFSEMIDKLPEDQRKIVLEDAKQSAKKQQERLSIAQHQQWEKERNIKSCYDIFKDEKTRKKVMNLDAIAYKRTKAVENRMKRDINAIQIAKDMKVDTPFWRVILKNNKSGEIIDIVCLQHSISDTEYICKNIYNCEKEKLKFNMAEYTSILRDYYPIG